jgi:hypothetical protein
LKTKHIVLAALLVTALVVLLFPYFYTAPVREYQPDPYPKNTIAPRPSESPPEPTNYPDNTLGKMQQLQDTQQDERIINQSGRDGSVEGL